MSTSEAVTVPELNESQVGAILDVLQERKRISVAQLTETVGLDLATPNIPLARLPQVLIDGDDVVFRLSQDERTEFERLETEFQTGQRASIEALREIRQRRLYREQFPSFDAYLAQRWARTRQWVTQQVNWLRCVERLEKNGKDSYRLTADDAQVVCHLADKDPELFMLALEHADREATNAHRRRKKSDLEAAVTMVRRFSFLREQTESDPTFDDFLVLSPLDAFVRSESFNLVKEAQEESQQDGSSLSECLVRLCDRHHTLPANDHLLAVARGDALRQLVTPLLDLSQIWKQRTSLAQAHRKLEFREADLKRKAAFASVPPEAAGDVSEKADLYYDVHIDGDFVKMAGYEGEAAEMRLSADDLVTSLFRLGSSLEEKTPITKRSSLVVTPVEATTGE